MTRGRRNFPRLARDGCGRAGRLILMGHEFPSSQDEPHAQAAHRSTPDWTPRPKRAAHTRRAVLWCGPYCVCSKRQRVSSAHWLCGEPVIMQTWQSHLGRRRSDEAAAAARRSIKRAGRAGGAMRVLKCRSSNGEGSTRS